MDKKLGLSAEKGILGRVVDLAGLVDYQADAVVSKTLVKKKAGTVTLFAFDKGQGLSEHTAPYDAMALVIDGEVDITVSGNTKRVKKGEMIIMPANEPHELMGVERFKMVLVMVRSD